MSCTAHQRRVHRQLQRRRGRILEDCIESESAERDWLRAQSSKLQVQLEEQLSCNEELQRKYRTLKQENRRCRAGRKANREAVRTLCKEYASSSMVATNDDGIGISTTDLVERLRDRLQQRHKRHRSILQDSWQRNSDLECILNNHRPEELQACRRTIRYTHSALSTMLQLVHSKTSACPQDPTCGHTNLSMTSFTACDTLLCQLCRNDLQERNIIMGVWMEKCPWCLSDCAAYSLLPSVQFPWTPGWKDAMDSLGQVKDDLRKILAL